MNIIEFAIGALKYGYRALVRPTFINPNCDISRESANDKIYSLLSSDQPCMISRFGTTELICINNYLCINSQESIYRKIWEYVSGNTHLPWWKEDHFKYMELYSGVFPANKYVCENFSQLYLNDIPLIDILGSFQYYERFMPLRPDTQYIHLETLYPFFVEKPWTRVLKGKKILIIHPFDSTINYQYNRRKYLFANEDILPDFEIQTLKAIQSAAGDKVPFTDWFDALEYMKKKISLLDFDICLLGCGAYGLPLASHVKLMGKKAIHIGGGLQLLFGIKGKRWDDINYGKSYNIPSLFQQPYSNLYNDYWIKPLLSDTPEKSNLVDNACYW